MTENLLQAFPNVLTLRVRMPIVADLTYPRNFITKIIKYFKVVNIPNSMTVLPELIPLSIEMSKRKLTGAPIPHVVHVLACPSVAMSIGALCGEGGCSVMLHERHR